MKSSESLQWVLYISLSSTSDVEAEREHRVNNVTWTNEVTTCCVESQLSRVAMIIIIIIIINRKAAHTHTLV